LEKLESSYRVACFDGFELDLRSRELVREGDKPVSLAEQPFRILAMLLARPGDLVSREEIRAVLWPNGTIVEFEHSISAAINRLRQVLGDSAEQPRYIETLARRGYRWKMKVDWVVRPPEGARSVNVEAAPEAAIPIDRSLTGKKIAHYRVLELLGGGGMGVVYKAEDLKLGRRVALKFLPEELASDPAALHRFEREARAASALNHPNICTIYEIEEHEETPFLVMELLEGETLREVISRAGPGRPALDLTQLLDLAIQISDGLDAAHRLGIIHRDIKPANIFVTTQGQAKILDFGLAKLAPATAFGAPEDAGRPRGGNLHEQSCVLASLTIPNLGLSHTGLAMGTAGYMSPEQARGEMVDLRTDLFSFGLVLYEMATNQRAFSGGTAPELHHAILRETPTPVRKLNPKLPPKIEKIIDRGLEKDREARYQYAAEMRADLKSLRREREPRPRAGKWTMAAGATAAVFIVTAIFWLSRFARTAVQSPPKLKLHQLTANSFENRVTSGALSPDGKYLAYSDMKGIYVKLTETGETRVVQQPGELRGKDVNWEVVRTWFPNSTSFVANAYPESSSGSGPENVRGSQGSSIWAVSILGGPPQKLRENAVAYSVSPNGSLIGFGSNKGRFGDREIWAMGPTGEDARRLFETDEESSIGGLDWSKSGKRVLYVRSDPSGRTLLSRDLQSGPATTVLGAAEMKLVNDFFWLADGRLLYSVAEHELFSGSVCNLWEMRLDVQSGAPAEKPRQITDWSGSCPSGMSETSDGKKLGFLRWAGKQTSFLADLAEGGARILNPRHFPLSENSEGSTDWTPDGKTIILVSNRGGHTGIYKQSLDQDVAEPIVTEGFGRNPRVTPDGKSIVYLGLGEDGTWQGSEPVMRVSITGGPSQQLFTARTYSMITCAKSPPDLCVIAEPTEDRKLLTLTAIDFLKGRGPELFRSDLVANDDSWYVDLSPDGTRVAATRTSAGPIHILSLNGQPLRQIQVKGWTNLRSFVWAADGKGLFVTAGIRNGMELLHVDLQGNAHALWENTGATGETLGFPSPDGRHLAFNGWTTNGNMWMLENY
jgi:serine/threonine protein kinase